MFKVVNGERVEMTAEEIKERQAEEYEATRPRTPEELAVDIREKRNQLLTASDWTQTVDAPVDQVAWQDYRQALRDIPQQAGFPTDTTWPTKPE
jgi:hypothetical protein